MKAALLFIIFFYICANVFVAYFYRGRSLTLTNAGFVREVLTALVVVAAVFGALIL